MHARNVPVEHADVVLVDDEPLQGGLAVVDDVDGERLQSKAFSDRVRQLNLVLDHKYPHPDIMTGQPVKRTLAVSLTLT
ncbi:hypothetical protein Axi01nite_50810 [Actinoplanes xinjiangensis]|nr:hypothetical protein Axi01nite_50810 [Actinoplanes xinjiangensis]